MSTTDRRLDHRYWTRGSFDDLVERVRSSHFSFEEAELLSASHWALGEDARLREDVRFRPTPWGRWILSDTVVANDTLYHMLRTQRRFAIRVQETLSELERGLDRSFAICKADPRIVVEEDLVRLSSKELSDLPLFEFEPTELEKYVTHLPVHTLKAAAASEPAGEWGPEANEQAIETLGWLKVSLPGHKLNRQMFVARIEGNSMDNGRNGLVDGAYAVFELWPKLSRQNLVVLVRGAFTDPETGSYAVKKYVADQRDKEGSHHKVTLVSLNPNKERYPDIELAVEHDDAVTVVARFVQALTIEDFARQPKKIKKPGRRDLTSENALDRIGKSLSKHAQRFFEAPKTNAEAKEAPEPDQWMTEVVCLEAESGGLHLEIGPLTGLWRFVKRLRIVGQDWDAFCLSSNVRQRPERVRVPPSAGPWRVEAVGFEDDPDVDLSYLDCKAVGAHQVQAFRVDAAGIGRAVKTRRLSPGQDYRLLLSPGVAAETTDLPGVTALPDGWQIWELSLPLAPSEELVDRIVAMGFALGCPQPRLDWVLVPPAEWRTSARGAVYPCFLKGADPVVAIEGLTLYLENEALLFLHGPTGTHPMKLPQGESLLVHLRSLAPGRWVLALLHRDTRILPARLAFEVVPQPPRPPRAEWRLTWNDEVHASGDGAGVKVGPTDLTLLDLKNGDEAQITLEMPPGWPGGLSWKEVAEDDLGRVHAGLDGGLDLEEVLKRSRERRQRRPVGDLVLDFRELGRLTMKHEQASDPETIRNRLAELVERRAPTVRSLRGDFPQLSKIWFQPTCRLLGYDVDEAVSDKLSPTPAHMTAWRLVHTHRSGDKIERHAARLLTVLEDLPSALPDEVCEWIDAVCADLDLWDVILSDGLRWAVRRRGSKLSLGVFDLESLVKDSGAFLNFLRSAAEGV